MLATLGDLIDDVVVELDGPINTATDTSSTITRRRGGSAANVAATAALLRQRVRFIGQVGSDAIGVALTDQLTQAGVDTQFVQRVGTTGTIVVLVDSTGERTMLTDRGSSTALCNPTSEWLDDVTTLHVPLYSLFAEPIGTTARALIDEALDRQIAISLDLSSTSLMTHAGIESVRNALAELRPTVVFANADEAEVFGVDSLPENAIVVVKDGAQPALLRVPVAGRGSTAGTMLMIPAVPIATTVDTTGAGDAFAAGFLAFPDWRNEPAEACVHAHRAAHRILTGRRV